MEKIFIYEDFGSTLQFAGTLGFDEDAVLDEMHKEVGVDWNDSGAEADISDALEEAALDCIIEKGYSITY
jgi:hypothetical protein